MELIALTAQKLIDSLALWPPRIKDCEKQFILALEDQEDAARTLEIERDRLLTTPGMIVGKNAEEREAHVRTLTRGLADVLFQEQQKVRRSRCHLTWAENEFRAVKTQASLVTALLTARTGVDTDGYTKGIE